LTEKLKILIFNCPSVKKPQIKNTKIPKIITDRHISLLLSSSTASFLLLLNLHLSFSSLSPSILNPLSSPLFFSMRKHIFSSSSSLFI